MGERWAGPGPFPLVRPAGPGPGPGPFAISGTFFRKRVQKKMACHLLKKSTYFVFLIYLGAHGPIWALAHMGQTPVWAHMGPGPGHSQTSWAGAGARAHGAWSDQLGPGPGPGPSLSAGNSNRKCALKK